MKKQITNKLALRTETVRNLRHLDLQGVAGGISGTRICNTLYDGCLTASCHDCHGTFTSDSCPTGIATGCAC
jgi:hypothetical protein